MYNMFIFSRWMPDENPTFSTRDGWNFGMERYEASSGSREFFETTTTFCEKVVAHHFREGSLNYFF